MYKFQTLIYILIPLQIICGLSYLLERFIHYLATVLIQNIYEQIFGPKMYLFSLTFI